jgi:hypothetical protein
MRRAIFLLAFLPALAQAAPAPFPRERKDADARGWSKPVDGLRVRLVAQRARYRVGEAVRLTLEIQNVGDSVLVMEDPHLSRSISTPGDSSLGWAITCERASESGRLDKRLHKVRKEIEELRRMRDLIRLAAGEILRIEIHAEHGKLAEQKMKKLLEDGEPRQEDLRLSDADTPGVYELRATFRRDSRVREVVHKRAWSGKALTSPPVRIELHE